MTLKIIDKVLPWAEFDMSGGDCLLEEIQNHENPTIQNYVVQMIENHYRDRLVDENAV